MEKGKAKCNALKVIRRQIAAANGIQYAPHECHHVGDCAGTCHACEAEIRYLERELDARKRKGFSVKVAGLVAGVCSFVVPLASCSQSDTNKQQAGKKPVPVETVAPTEVELTGDTISVVDAAQEQTTSHEAVPFVGEVSAIQDSSQAKPARSKTAPRSHKEKCRN